MRPIWRLRGFSGYNTGPHTPNRTHCMQTLLMTCRAGMENDLAAEIQHHASLAQIPGYVRTQSGQGYLLFTGYEEDCAERCLAVIDFNQLIFARQWMAICHRVEPDNPTDRVSAIVAALEDAPPFQGIWLTFPDTNEGKALSRLTRQLDKPLQQALKQHFSRSTNKAEYIAQVFFLGGQQFFVGVTPTANASPWPAGYPRLRQPGSAPSRSTLKLEEAWLQLLTPKQREYALQSGMRAVDLGAAPGGWTWQLVQKNMWVTAIDNGPMDAGLLDSGLVTHRREDAFRYQPAKPVDWMVCDVVDKPSRVAQRMAQWLTAGWCRFTVFNLKLPMKKRWQTVDQLLGQLHTALAINEQPYVLRARQLYHDREEITVFVSVDRQFPAH